MENKAFQKWISAHIHNLTPLQKLAVANALGFSQEQDNYGQILFYTDLKEDEKSGRLRRLRDVDFK